MVQGNNCHGVGHGLMPQSCCLMAVTKPWHIKQPKCGSWCLSALPNEYFFLYLLWVGPGWGCTSPALRRPNTICLRRSCRPSSECNLVQLVNEMPRRCRQEHRGLNGSMYRGCELRQKKKHLHTEVAKVVSNIYTSNPCRPPEPGCLASV